MSILSDDIMTIDSACGQYTVTFWQVHLIRRALWMPAYSAAHLSHTFTQDFESKVAISIERWLADKPIMELTDEFIESVLMSHIKQSERKYCRFFGMGHPWQLRRDAPDHWELVYKRTKYSTKCAIVVYPFGHPEPKSD